MKYNWRLFIVMVVLSLIALAEAQPQTPVPARPVGDVLVSQVSPKGSNGKQDPWPFFAWIELQVAPDKAAAQGVLLNLI